MCRAASGLGVLLILAVLPSRAPESGFQADARQAMAAIAAGDLRQFSRVAADEVTVARREVDPDRSGKLRGTIPAAARSRVGVASGREHRRSVARG